MTGQFIARGPYSGPKGEPIYMLLGIVSDPNKILKGEHQYTILVPPILTNPVDVSKQTQGDSPSGILRSPIWRI